MKLIILLIFACLLGADAPHRTFDDLLDWHISRDTNGYFVVPNGRDQRRAWMLERARSLRGNADAIVHAMEHGGRRDATLETLVDSGAIVRELIRADQYTRGKR